MVEIKDLSFTYPDGHGVLHHITLKIDSGEVFGVIGPTGAGKSTLLLHLNGLLMGSGGEVRVDGLTTGKENESTIRSNVGVVFQNPDDQLFCPTVYDDIAFGLYNQGLEAGEIDKRVDAVLEKLDLTGMKDLSSHHLSFGEKKRVALATVLVMNPRVIALDEPFANLDYRSIVTIVDILRNLDLTRIVVSQDILLALSICDRVALLDRGRVIKVASPADIASDREALSRSGIDFLPYLDLIKKFL